MKIGHKGEAEEKVGQRDAFHVPAVLVKWVGPGLPLPGGDVRFVDNSFTQVMGCEEEDRNAVIDPFVPAIEIQGDVSFWVLLIPEATSNLTHNFNINLPNVPQKVDEDEDEDEDEYEDEYDGCRGCW